jgi:ABC-type Zn2+ transport system substrate-binding protein/surface adhesin
MRSFSLAAVVIVAAFGVTSLALATSIVPPKETTKHASAGSAKQASHHHGKSHAHASHKHSHKHAHHAKHAAKA